MSTPYLPRTGRATDSAGAIRPPAEGGQTFADPPDAILFDDLADAIRRGDLRDQAEICRDLKRVDWSVLPLRRTGGQR